MTPDEKYYYWEKLADYDMETAKILLDADRGVYVANFCQQALERILKGMIVYHTGKEAPKTHSITFLCDRLNNDKFFSVSPKGEKFDDEKNDYMEFFIEIMFFHITDYPFSYKKVMDRFISREKANELYEKTSKAMDWLKSYQK